MSKRSLQRFNRKEKQSAYVKSTSDGQENLKLNNVLFSFLLIEKKQKIKTAKKLLKFTVFCLQKIEYSLQRKTVNILLNSSLVNFLNAIFLRSL